ncbi:MAG TPA: neuraminidase-like domain-containing protein, partial [Mycobacterium sp.]|nr:neuraminidase-like domain-containing protein [Mycobacterium sp.]
MYDKLRTDFSSCGLPYSQPLDVSRTYLCEMGSSRFEEMRHFRRCITEFVLDPTVEPTGFASWLWRYPVRIDTAIEYLGITPEEYTTLFGGVAAPPCGEAPPPNGDDPVIRPDTAPAPADAAPVAAPPAPQPAEPQAPPALDDPAVPPDEAIATDAHDAPGDATPDHPATSQPGLIALTVTKQADNPPAGQAVSQSAQTAVTARHTVGLTNFLADTCLSYCEFYELWQSGYVPFSNGAAAGEGSPTAGAFPPCEPCCPDGLWLQFPGEQPEQDLAKLTVFVRLWRKLQTTCRDRFTFAQLRDICDVLHMRNGNAPNPDFIRQLAAFTMLHNEFGIPLTDPDAATNTAAVDAERTPLLALWVGPTATHWPWALRQLIARIGHHAQRRHQCVRRTQEFIKLLVDNLDPLSRLAGFDPDSPTDSWHALPTHTLRFAEILAKIYASNFTVGELIFLFTAGPHLDGDDPFPLQPDNEALDLPLGLPDDDHEHALWRLRRELFITEEPCDDTDGDDDERWPWRRVEATLLTEFGFATDDVTNLAEHFFPHLMARPGTTAPDPSAAWFTSDLPAASTSAPMWNDPPDGPLRYDPAAGQLTAQLPLTDHAILTKLTHVRTLGTAERAAVQDLYFQPRSLLTTFALLFDDFAAAQHALIEEPDEHRRYAYFARQVRGTHDRAHAIARHLEHHVAAITGHEPCDDGTAALILTTLSADENTASSSWEADTGTPPDPTWGLPSASALASLLGLAGTGLTVDYHTQTGALVWRDVSAGLGGFGHERNCQNSPVPTIVPALDTALTPQQMQYAIAHNGMLMQDATDTFLGGAQGFTATWAGTLLIDGDGTYEFWAGAPTPADERPDMQACDRHRWRVTIRRGQRTWVILSHHWDGEEQRPATALPLKRGAYEITAEFIQPTPAFDDDDDVRVQHTGFQVKYSGPDTDGLRTEIPHRVLFNTQIDQAMFDGIPVEGLGPSANDYLCGLYRSSLRDIRRTYQRAFKTLLFCRRLGLTARRQRDGESELEYLLDQGARFAGSGYYRTGGTFVRHGADLDFDFLPIGDNYHPPTPATDIRTTPTPQRISAMFDWAERLFDYSIARDDVHHRGGHTLWRLFDEAEDKHPAHPGYLMRYIGADARHWPLDLHYYQCQNCPVYAVTSDDLTDERWTLRAWHADRWLRTLRGRYAVTNIQDARPDLWACDDPAATLPGETQPGNVNLVGFLTDSALENGLPRRYHDLREINDGLRERGRRALIAYLCHGNRVHLPSGQFATTPHDLSDLLLLDVQAGHHEKASRIQDAVTAVQTFIRRSRLGLEPAWPITRDFARLWDCRFDTFHTWRRARTRELYRENWIEWEELGDARRTEAFQFLQSQLPTSTLTMAAPGGLDWWPDDNTDLETAPELLQRRVPSHLQTLTAEREGLTTIGYPEYADEPTWLAALPAAASPETSNGGDGGGEPGDIEHGDDPPHDGPAENPIIADAAMPLAPGKPDNPAHPADPAPTPGPVTGTTPSGPLPLWIQAAIKLGTRFVRVAAAGVPQAALEFVPHTDHPKGACCTECGTAHPAGVDEYYFWLINTQVYTEDLDTT